MSPQLCSVSKVEYDVHVMLKRILCAHKRKKEKSYCILDPSQPSITFSSRKTSRALSPLLPLLLFICNHRRPLVHLLSLAPLLLLSLIFLYSLSLQPPQISYIIFDFCNSRRQLLLTFSSLSTSPQYNLLFSL